MIARSLISKWWQAQCLLLVMVVGTMLPVSAASAEEWLIQVSKLADGKQIVCGTVRNGAALLSMSCASGGHHSYNMVLAVSGIEMPRPSRIEGVETKFRLYFELGEGSRYFIPFFTTYHQVKRTWRGENPFAQDELEILGQAKSLRLTNAAKKPLVTFTAKGTRKLEQTMRRRCFSQVK